MKQSHQSPSSSLSHPPPSNPQITLFHHLQSLNSQATTLQFFDLLVNKNNTTYIDKQKKYQIIKSKYLTQLQQSKHSLKKQLDQILKSIKQSQYHQNILNKVVQMKNKQIEEIKIINQNLKNQNLSSSLIISNYFNIIQQKQTQYQILLEKYQHQFQLHNTINQLLPIQQQVKQYKEIGTQSLYDITPVHYQLQQPPPNIPPQTIQSIPLNPTLTIQTNTTFQQQQKKLNQSFTSLIQHLSKTIQQKLLQIQTQKQLTKQWIQQNKKLRQQNAQLKKQIKSINLQQQQITIFKNSLQNYISNIQSLYQKQTNNYHLSYKDIKQNSIATNFVQHTQNIKDPQIINSIKQQKIKILQATIDKLQATDRQKQRKKAEIKILLQGNQNNNINQQNIINNILELSSKIKQFIKYLLQDI